MRRQERGERRRAESIAENQFLRGGGELLRLFDPGTPHVPEVLLTSGIEERDFSFTAQLIPIDRGILETIYFRMARPVTGAEIMSIYEAQYGNEPFVRLYEAGGVPDLHAVRRTNFCDIGGW